MNCNQKIVVINIQKTQYIIFWHIQSTRSTIPCMIVIAYTCDVQALKKTLNSTSTESMLCNVQHAVSFRCPVMLHQ